MDNPSDEFISFLRSLSSEDLALLIEQWETTSDEEMDQMFTQVAEEKGMWQD